MYRMYGIRAMQRDAAFRSDASGTPRATKVLNICYFFAILSDLVVTLRTSLTREKMDYIQCIRRPQQVELRIPGLTFGYNNYERRRQGVLPVHR